MFASLLAFQMQPLASSSLALFPMTFLPRVQKQALHCSPPHAARTALHLRFGREQPPEFPKGPRVLPLLLPLSVGCLTWD